MVVVSQRSINNDRDELILRLLSHSSSPLILDIGCLEHCLSYIERPNWFFAKILKRFPDKVFGIDIDAELCANVNSLLGGDYVKAVTPSQGSNPYPFKFTAVHLGDVIEHVSDQTPLFNLISSSLRSDIGRLVLTTPNLVPRLPAMLKHRSFARNLDHVSWLMPDNIVEVLHRYNFSLESIYVVAPKSITFIRKLPFLRFIDDFYYIWASEFIVVATKSN